MDFKDGLKLLPEHMRGAMERYISEGMNPGGFLTSVLSDQLVEAVGRADLANRARLHSYAEFLMWHAPNGSWGSPEAVEGWIKRGGLNGLHNEWPADESC